MRSRQLAILFATVVGLAVAASASSLANGFAFDDIALVAQNPRAHSLEQWWRLFSIPYWPPSYGASLYRPIVTLGYALQWTASHGAPWLFHATSVVLYAAACMLVLALLVRLLPPAGALIAAAAFAVHPVHVEAVANVVGQSELIAAVAMLAACVVYLRGRRAGRLQPAAIATVAALFAVACLAKEHAVLLPAVLVALEVFAVDEVLDNQPAADWRARARELAPLYLTLAAVGIAYITVRTAAIGNVLGEQHLVPMDGSRRVWTMLVVAPHWVRLLLWPVHLSAEYSPQHIRIPDGPGPEILAGVVIVACAVVLFIVLGGGGASRRPDRADRAERAAARLGLAWTAVMLLPVSNLFSVMLVAERTLFLPSVGAMLVLGAGASVVWNRLGSRGRSRVGQVVAATTAAAVIATGVARSSARQRVWRDDAALFRQMVEDAPRSYRAQFFYGQSLFAQGRRSEGERRLRLAIELNPTPSDVSPLNYLATQYRDAGMCTHALPLYERALTNDPARPDVRYGLASCLLDARRVADARRLIEDGLRRGDLRSLFLALLARADSASAGAAGGSPAASQAGSPTGADGRSRGSRRSPRTSGRPAAGG